MSSFVKHLSGHYDSTESRPSVWRPDAVTIGRRDGDEGEEAGLRRCVSFIPVVFQHLGLRVAERVAPGLPLQARFQRCPGFHVA